MLNPRLDSVAPSADLAAVAQAAPTRFVAVCVDDFGLHEGVNQAVFDLLALRRISAVSCLVDGPAWAGGAERLRQSVQGADGQRVADVGLHLNLTETLDVAAQATLPSRPLSRVIADSYLRRQSVPALRAEIERQWDRFEAVWGAAPDFVDGHQHVHQLPQVRQALMQVMARRVPASSGAAKPWLRQCRSPGWRGLRVGVSLSDTVKASVIATLGAFSLGRAARSGGWPHSHRLLGVYPFDADAQAYLGRWRAWLQLLSAPSGHGACDVLMCHPAKPTPTAPPWPDAIAPSRHMEHAVLSSPAWGALLAEARVGVRRLQA